MPHPLGRAEPLVGGASEPPWKAPGRPAPGAFANLATSTFPPHRPHVTCSFSMTTQKRWTLVAAVLGSGIVFLDSTVVNVALPKIGQSLHSSFLGAFAAENFVYYGYLLSLSALLILAGALNDYFGRRKMFAIGLAAFGVMSLLCGVALAAVCVLVFSPAVLVLAGRGAWWLPAWLDRVLPHVDVEGAGAKAERPVEAMPSGTPAGS